MLKIVLFTNDLMFQSRVGATVRAAGNELIVVRSIDMLRERCTDATSPAWIVFDLSFRNLDLGSTVSTIQAEYPNAQTLAYGAHVDIEALEHARQLGIQHVLTRGQFDRDMARWLGTGA